MTGILILCITAHPHNPTTFDLVDNIYKVGYR
jgi:hypothetical protein